MVNDPSSNDTPPNLEFIASQLRQPSGDFASTIADNMDKSNEFLYDLTLETMGLKPEQSVLEIGFGSGSFLHKLFDRVPDLQMTGIDFSAEMVKLAKSKNQKYIENNQLELKQGDSDNLPFDDSTFDKVFCINVIYFWEKPADHLKEIRRVLKPDGIFYAYFRTKETFSKLPFTKFGFKHYTVQEWRDVLEQSGFEINNVKEITEPKPVGQPLVQIQLESACVAAKAKK